MEDLYHLLDDKAMLQAADEVEAGLLLGQACLLLRLQLSGSPKIPQIQFKFVTIFGANRFPPRPGNLRL